MGLQIDKAGLSERGSDVSELFATLSSCELADAVIERLQRYVSQSVEVSRTEQIVLLAKHAERIE